MRAAILVALAVVMVWAGVGSGQMPVERVGGKMVFHGILVDEGGGAVGGAKYAVYRWEWPEERLEAEGVTGADGMFTVGPAAGDEEGRVGRLVVFDVPGKEWVWTQVDDRNMEAYLRGVRVVAKGASRVAGVVRDEAGKPVAGAMVEGMVQGETAGIWALGLARGRVVKTDGNGRFVLDRIPAGERVSLRVTSAAGTSSMVAAYGFGVYPVRPGMGDVEMVVRPAGEVRVQLMAGGKALARAGVWVAAAEGQRRELPMRVQTDARGVAVFGGMEPGQWTFSGGRRPEMEEGVMGRVAVDIGHGETKAVGLVVVKGGEVRGQLVDVETKRGIAGRVQVAQAGQALRDVFAGADGLFRVRLPAGEYSVEAYGSEAGQGKMYRQAVKVAEGEAAAVELAVHPRLKLKGQLVDETGKAVAGMVVVRSTALLTDDAGRFEVDGDVGPMGAYGAGLNAARTLGRGFLLTGKERGELRLALAPMASVAGRVVDGAGTGVADAEVSLAVRTASGGWESPPMWVWEGRVGKDGTFRFGPVPPGLAVDLLVNRHEQQALVKLGELAAGDDRDVADVVLHERGAATQMARRGAIVDRSVWDGEIAGRVVDENGRAVVGARVNLRLASGGGEGDVTDIHGKFVIKGVPRQGAVEVGAGLDRRSGTAQLEAGAGREVKIVPQGFELLGKAAPAMLVEKWIVAGPAGKDGEGPASWEDFRGKVVLLHAGVWRKGGGSDVETVKRLLERYRGNGLEAVTVHIDQDAEEGELKAYAERFGIDWAFGVDADPRKVAGLAGRTENGAMEAVLGGAGFFVVDKKGVLRAAPGWREMEAVIEKLLAE